MAFEPVGSHQCKNGEVYLAIVVDVTRQSGSATGDLGAVEYDGVYLGIAAAAVLPDYRVSACGRVGLVAGVVGDLELPAGCEVVAEYVPVAGSVVLPDNCISVYSRALLVEFEIGDWKLNRVA